MARSSLLVPLNFCVLACILCSVWTYQSVWGFFSIIGVSGVPCLFAFLGVARAFSPLLHSLFSHHKYLPYGLCGLAGLLYFVSYALLRLVVDPFPLDYIASILWYATCAQGMIGVCMYYAWSKHNRYIVTPLPPASLTQVSPHSSSVSPTTTSGPLRVQVVQVQPLSVPQEHSPHTPDHHTRPTNPTNPTNPHNAGASSHRPNSVVRQWLLQCTYSALPVAAVPMSLGGVVLTAQAEHGSVQVALQLATHVLLLLAKELTLEMFKQHMSNSDFRFVSGCFFIEFLWHYLQAFSYFSILNVSVYIGFIAIKCAAFFAFPLMQTPVGIMVKNWVAVHVLGAPISAETMRLRAQRASMVLFLSFYTQTLAHIAFLLQITLFRFVPQSAPMFFFRDFTDSQYNRTVIFVLCSCMCLLLGFVASRAVLALVHNWFHVETCGDFPDPIEVGSTLFDTFRDTVIGTTAAATAIICLMCCRHAQVFFYFFTEPSKFLAKQ
eukprot:TRINITY_DN16343_c0_g1_i11.p1 TRINITY_DN16343_c0_g1~~TRINITY_DN16343_c0_g1_i11.p1  ORF type:complete len:492 (-),score=65.90 TRINITY_DN16343_c0_g1_i11:150-1625(-)